jgi:PelA/Pel-15E family pectate lyase
MSSLARSAALAVWLTGTAAATATVGQSAAPPARDEILAVMKRATRFMVEEVSTDGGYVWSYLPDRSRRWGELEARPTQIWIQPPGTPTMGHLFLDAYHATRDEYYYRAAEAVAGALIRAQLPSGGWNYFADFAGERSTREWYDTVGRNAWRMEEFQHHWGNATFDDSATAAPAKFLLRLYVEKRDTHYKPALDKAIRFVLDSQYPIGGWPQRFPAQRAFERPGHPDYTSYVTFNDGVAGENIEFLVMCHQALGEDSRVRDAITRGMNAVLVTQLAAPQPGWALQYTTDLKPAAARSYEPKALATHTTAANIELLLRFHRLTGDARLLARIPEALDWLERLALPAGIGRRGDTHPTFVEIGTNKPLYVHRHGSNVVNGKYYADHDPAKTPGHYSAFRRLDVAGLRRQYEQQRAMTQVEATAGSPLRAAAGTTPLERFFVAPRGEELTVADAVSGLNEQGYWPARLGSTSHRFTQHGSPEPAAGDFSQSHVGDETDTSPFPDDKVTGISTTAYQRHMAVLLRAVDVGSGR